MKQGAKAFAVALCCTGCGSHPHASTPGPADPQVPSQPSTTRHAAAQEDADAARAKQQVERMLVKVSRMRSLPARGPVAGRIIDRATMLRQVKDQVRTQVPAAAIRGESEFLKSFGFIPSDFDYEAGVYGLIENQLAGYYDPDRKTMFLIADLSRLEAEVTLAHELVHALQDQHYDLGPRLKYRKNANDAQAALHCLAEGDATSLMLDYTLESSGVQAFSIPDGRLRLEIAASMAMSPDLASFPRVLRESLVAPYVDGVLFVHALRRRGGWDLVDRVWKDPPATTEQVLHLDKLDAREPGESVPDPRPPRGNWSTLHTEVYGEQGVRIAFEEWLPRRVAVAAARGWAGDHAAVLRSLDHDSGVTVAAWHVRFDSGVPSAGSEAEEAFEALASAWNVRKLHSQSFCHTLANGRLAAVARNGRDVAIVAAPNAAANETYQAFDCTRLAAWAFEVASQP